MWKTKGSRFNAYERLRRTQKLSFYTTSLLSAYLIVINLLEPFNLTSGAIEPRTISFISTALSIILLVFVILENSAEYNLKGAGFHNCAKDIGRLFNQLHSILDKNETDISKYEEIADKYSDILDRYDNHSPIDYEVHKTKHPDDFKLHGIQKEWIRLKANYLIHGHYFLFMFGPPIAFMIWINGKIKNSTQHPRLVVVH